MSNQEAPVVITDISGDFGFLLFNQAFSDLKIVIGDEEIAAHKIILCKRSQYFADVLLKNPQQKTLSFHVLDIVVFREFLKFLYSDVLNFDLLDPKNFVELIKMGKTFSVPSLEFTLLNNLKKYLTVERCCHLLKAAVNSTMENLSNEILKFMNQNVDELLSGNFLNTLTQEAMVRLLSRDDFVATEMEIFRCVKRWREKNIDRNNLVAKCVKLSRFTRKQLLEVGRSDFIDRITLLDVLSKMEDGSLIVEERQIKNQNLASPDFGAKVISGTDTDILLPDINLDDACHHIDGALIIELRASFCFNHIQLLLGYNDDYSYYIEVSRDNSKWERIVNYNSFVCRSQQNLFFDKVSAKFVKIAGTKSSTSSDLYLEFVKIFLVDEPPQVVSGVIRPTHNVAIPSKENSVEAKWNPDTLLNGNKSEKFGRCTAHIVNDGRILIKLGQPFLLSSARLLLFGEHHYRYLVETSTNHKNWQIAVDKRNEDCHGWQNLEFEERVVVFIKITGTKSTCSNVFACVHFESPSVPEAAALI